MTSLVTIALGLNKFKGPARYRDRVSDDTRQRVVDVFTLCGERLATPFIAVRYGITVPSMHNTLARLEKQGVVVKDGYDEYNGAPARMWRLKHAGA